MRLKLTLQRPPGQADASADLLVTVDTTVTVGELAAAIGQRDPVAPLAMPKEGVTLAVHDGSSQRPLRADATVADAGLQSGQTVAVVKRSTKTADVGDGAALLVVEAGPDKGKEFTLPSGPSYVGRRGDNTVKLNDRMVSGRHARIIIGETIQIVDLDSSNGVTVGETAVDNAVLTPSDLVTLGESVVRISRRGGVTSASTAPTVEFNRSPRIDIVYEGVAFEAPEPPSPPEKQRFSIAMVVAPLLMGAILYAVTGNLLSILFVAMSPLMMIGNVVEQRIVGKRAFEEAVAAFREGLDVLRDELSQAAQREIAGRHAEQDAVAVVLPAARQRSNLLWSRRPDRRGFGDVRIGVATLPSRNSVKLPSRGKTLPSLWAELTAVRDDYLFVADVPAVASLRDHGALGIAGPRLQLLDMARSVVTQLVVLHSPAEMVVGAILSASSADDWEWVKWLPHTTSDHNPLATETVGASAAQLLRLVSELEDLIDKRSSVEGTEPERVPGVVVLVEDDASVERSRLVHLVERGPAVGVHVVWLAPTVAKLPAGCGVFVDAGADGPNTTIGYTVGGAPAFPVVLEPVDEPTALNLARSMSPLVDAGARVDDDSDLPRNVSLLAVTGADIAASGAAVLERWEANNSLPTRSDSTKRRRKRDNHLRSTIGVAAGRNLELDLREHGPHALVGGTTGSGKSEFLQSWVISIAAEHSPKRVTFLFVDYKGGAAFADCVALPHCVGLVTDLTPHLVQRALRSLKAELRHREHVLQANRAKDLVELEKKNESEAPPSLVIVVDEFAALVNEVPEFVDGVVDVAQRGRSLGLHLVLATQNPGQSIRDNLRANTNLRVALRMADPEHSLDVIGTNQAALFDPGLPGRAVVKTGAGRLTPFQTGYVGGHTSDTPPPPIMTVDQFTVAERVEWEAPPAPSDEAPEPDAGPNDLRRLVQSVRSAYGHAFGVDVKGAREVQMPRRPWLDDLAPIYDLGKAEQSRTDEELRFAILDDPETQSQRPAAFFPDRDGNMAVYGTGGSGKSNVLRTLAVLAGLSSRGGPCHVYGLDFGTRSLQMLEPLDHVGAIVDGNDTERVQRLLSMLHEMIDERAGRFAEVSASTITQYRELADRRDEPRVLLLLDGIAAFRDDYEIGPYSRFLDMFQTIVAEGRPLGIHVVLTADRPGAVPSALSSLIQKRLVLRLASEDDYMILGAPKDAFTADSPPGRGVFEDKDVQVLVLGGSVSASHQSTAVKHLAEQLRAADKRGVRVAPPVGRLADRIPLSDLPPVVNELPVLGVSFDSLQPMGFAVGDPFVIAGPPQSGRSSVIAAIAQSLVGSGRKRLAYFGAGRSLLAGAVTWQQESFDEPAMAERARELAAGAVNEEIDAVFIEDFPSVADYDTNDALEALIGACRKAGVTVVADADTASVTSSQLFRSLLSARHGLVLVPDPFDGENLFKTPLPPRIPRNEFPPGRGFYIRGGRTWRVQCSYPDVSGDDVR